MARVETSQALLTAEELWQMPDDGQRYELVKGELWEMTPAAIRHGDIASEVAWQLRTYVKQHGGGKVLIETGFCLECQPDTVRAPDVSFVAAERLSVEDQDSFFPGAPDLAVEVVSPDDTDAQVHDKVLDYLTHGTRLVWVVRPHQRTVTVYRPDGTVRLLRETDTLGGEDVVAGFTCPLAEIFG
ncbi:MAG TPA: Uma2 family endonuclease [Anaerolineae bacterium]|nr:Uma2 family endonuclease [Anaerolineae bacterium]